MASSVSWWRSAVATASSRDTTLTRTAVALALPWLLVCLYALRWCVLRWRARGDAATAAVVQTFYQALADGASPGYDHALLRLLHPSLLQSGRVERGILRAMARCTHDTFGPVRRVPTRTLCVRRDGMQVHAVALVHFAKVSSVTCELTWVQRLSPAAATATTTIAALQQQQQQLASSSHRFHVTAFRIIAPAHVHFDVLRFLRVDEFEHFAESFVVRLLTSRPPTPAIAMLASPLQLRYASAATQTEMQSAVARVIAAAGGLGDDGDGDDDARSEHYTADDVDMTLLSSKLLTTTTDDKNDKDNNNKGDAAASSLTAVRGIEMTYQVRCRVRHMEVYVCLGFDQLRCCVTKYELRLQPDTRTHVLHDHDDGTTTIVR